MIKYLNEGEKLLDIIGNDLYLVDFYADWCGPCKMLAPVLEEIDFVNILKINTDTFHDVANEYGIISIPTLIFFKDGKEVKKIHGYHNLDDIKEAFDSIK